MTARPILNTGIKTVQVTVDCPWPAISGGDIRNAFVARAAARLGPVHVISFGSCSQAEAPAGVSVTCLPEFTDRNPWNCRIPGAPTSIQISDASIDFIASEIHRIQPDAAILEGVWVAEAYAAFAQAGVPVVLDMHNIESDLFRAMRQASFSRRIRDVLFGARRRKGLVELDRDLSRKANETWVVSQADAEKLRRIGGAGSYVISNPIPDERMFELDIAAERYSKPSVLYVGHLGYQPNVNAACELALKIWPDIRGGQAGAQLTIVGRSPSRHIMSLQGIEGLSLLADPADVVPLAQTHGYSLMPIQQGGGTRIKALEAMAAGLVVIATAKAIEGLGVQSGKHYLAAEKSAEFVARLNECCANPEATALMASDARDFVRKNHGYDFLAGQICERLLSLPQK